METLTMESSMRSEAGLLSAEALRGLRLEEGESSSASKVQAMDANFGQPDPVNLRSLLSSGIFVRAAVIAGVLGSILTGLNQSAALFGPREIQWWPLVLVYLTPFITVAISQVMGIRQATLDVMYKKVRLPIEEHFLSTATSHGIPSRAIWTGLMIGSVNLSIVLTTLFLQNETLSSIPVALLGQAYFLPVLFGVLSQAISYRRATRAFIQQKVTGDKKTNQHAHKQHLNLNKGEAMNNKLNIPTSNETSNEISRVTAREWFALGSRVPYDHNAKEILRLGDTTDSPDVVQVFRRIAKDATPDADVVWTSFLPGWPDGSFGWAKVDQHLTGKEIGPRLFIEYVGHGDSDKPGDYPYGTIERADLIEAMWKAEGIRSTFLVCFDYSSIVALELLSRQQDRREKGVDQTTKIEGVLLINGGLFAEAHTHPWYTTPILKSPIGGLVTGMAQRSKFIFREIMMPLWSKDYVVTPEETNELHAAMGRRNGIFMISKSADFVDHHKRNSERLNLERLFHASRDAVSFHIVGSEEDQIEGQQSITARERMGAQGLDVRILPGGHLSTSEHPDLLAQIIQEVVSLKRSPVDVQQGHSYNEESPKIKNQPALI